jgi:hypothetical protein
MAIKGLQCAPAMRRDDTYYTVGQCLSFLRNSFYLLLSISSEVVVEELAKEAALGCLV